MHLDQKITVRKQKAAIQPSFKYHLIADSERSHNVRPPNTNNRIGNAIFISLKSLNHTHLL